MQFGEKGGKPGIAKKLAAFAKALTWRLPALLQQVLLRHHWTHAGIHCSSSQETALQLQRRQRAARIVMSAPRPLAPPQYSCRIGWRAKK